MSAYRHCITESSADRQRQFEEALLALMGTKPFPQVSIQEICDRVGVSRKSFYRYFSGKEACLNALVDHAILGFTDVAHQGQRMQPMLEKFFSYWFQRKPLLDALWKSEMTALFFERAMYCAIQEYGIQGYFQEDNGNYDRTVFFISGLFGVLLSWYAGDCKKTPAQLAATLGEALPQYPRGVF